MPAIPGMVTGRGRRQAVQREELGQRPRHRRVVGERGDMILPEVEILLREGVEIRRVAHYPKYNGRTGA